MKRATNRQSYGRGTCRTCKGRHSIDQFGRILAHKLPGSPARASRCGGTGQSPLAEKS